MNQIYFKRALLRKHPNQPPARLPRQLYPEPVEERYLTALMQIREFAKKEVDAKILPLLPGLSKTYARERKDDNEDFGDLADTLEQIRLDIVQEYTQEDIKKLAAITGKDVEHWNQRQMNGQLNGIVEIDVYGSEPWLAKEMGAFVVQNVSLIRSIDDEYLHQVEQLVSTSVRSGVRPEDIADELEERYDVSRSRAELIARDQIGKFNGQLTELRQTDLGIEEYIRRGVGDARERDSHRLINNVTFAWDDPPLVGHPGEDFQCRCWAEPSLAKFYDPES